jgi:CDP-glycerol glycerophosphotransferase (TagB/SpsB family)
MKAWDRRQGRNPGQQFTILILFPITINNAVNILKETVRLSEILNQDNVRFFLKPHPVTRLELILKHARLSLPSQIRVVEGDLSEYILEADVVVGNTSSSFLEAVAMGIPVIIVGDRSGITYNPIPEAVSQDIWALCYTAEEMVEAIRRFISYSHEDRRHLEDIGRDIRKSYFEPVTRESVRSFLRLPTQ